MITINQNDPVVGHPDLFVFSPSGEYNEVDLIECYRSDKPGKSICAYSAQLVKYGDVVYQQEQPLNENQIEALEVNAPMDEVLNNEDLVDGKINPQSLAQDPPAETVQPKPKKKIKPVKEEIVEIEEPETPVIPVEEGVVPPSPESEVVPEPIEPPPDPKVGDLVGENVE